MNPFARTVHWRWYVCMMLLLATMLNYMDRQTLSQVATDLKQDFQQRGLALSDEDYGYLELGFSFAFASGAVITGFLVDRLSVRLLYPTVLIGWSTAGFVTAWATDFPSLLACRIVLGVFEAGQWPCALTISQRILSRQDRTLGNGILQSGAAVGAILTPLVVQIMMGADPASWRGPFQVIGGLGILWVVGWFLLVRPGDLERPSVEAAVAQGEAAGTAPVLRWLFIRRFLVLIAVVVVINLCWQFFRAWLPKFLRESHDYSRTAVNYFIMGYYLATDLGSLSVGWAIRLLARRGWQVHTARLLLFCGCAALTSLAAVAAWMPAGWLLLVTLCVVGFGALGLFPNYYSFSQELTSRHQGKLTGILGCTTWIVTGLMQPLVGRQIDQTQSYAAGLMLAGLVPLIGCAALLLFWGHDKPLPASPDETDHQPGVGGEATAAIQAAHHREGIVDSSAKS